MKPGLADEIRKRDPFDLPEEEVVLNVVRTAAQLHEPCDRIFREHGISSALYNILRILRGLGGPGVASGEIAGRMVTPAPDVTRLVDRLEKLELATRERSDTDRRVVLVKLTPKGRRLLKKLHPLIEQAHREVLAHLSPAELQKINELMVKARNKPSAG